MKKNLSLMSPLMLGTILFFSTSCEKEPNGPAPIQENPAVSDPNLFLSNSETTEIDFGGILYKFQHGSNNMIEKVEESFSFEEEEDGVSVIIDLFSSHDLIYTNKRLTSINVESEVTYSMMENGEKEELFNGSESFTVAAEYNDKNLLTSLTETHPENFVFKIMRDYNGENKLIKETQTENNEEIQYQTFLWNGQNVVKDELFEQEGSSNERKKRASAALRRKKAFIMAQRSASLAKTVSEENTYADFDNKANPLNVLSLFGFSNGFFISANNPKKVNFSRNEDEGVAVISHEYDNKGRITKYTMTAPEEDPVSVIIKYKN